MTASLLFGALVAQLQAGYRDHISRHHLDAGEAALYLAVGNLTQSDAVISAWDAKLHYSFWRPVTAIRSADTDGNPGTIADPGWNPLLTTPPFRHYQTGAVLRAEGIGARVWAGIHFRNSDEVGDRMGARLGSWIAQHYLSCLE